VKVWKLLLPVPVVAALAMVPQDPLSPADTANQEQVSIATISELQYVNLQGAAVSVPARNVVEIRLLEDVDMPIRIELLYDNGDYSLVNTQAFHLLRNNGSTREVRLVRARNGKMRFPRLP